MYLHECQVQEESFHHLKFHLFQNAIFSSISLRFFVDYFTSNANAIDQQDRQRNGVAMASQSNQSRCRGKDHLTLVILSYVIVCLIYPCR